MSKVVLDVAMSVDGFTAGPNVGQAEPMGEGGERLHEWMWTAGDGPDGGVDAGFRTVDAIVGAAVRRGAGRADPGGETRHGGRDPPALPRREALMSLVACASEESQKNRNQAGTHRVLLT